MQLFPKILLLLLSYSLTITYSQSISIFPAIFDNSAQQLLFDSFQLPPQIDSMKNCPAPISTSTFLASSNNTPLGFDDSKIIITAEDEICIETLRLYCHNTIYNQGVCLFIKNHPQRTHPIFSIRHNFAILRKHYPLMEYIQQYGAQMLSFLEHSTLVSLKMNTVLTPATREPCYLWDSAQHDSCAPLVHGEDICLFLKRWCVIRLMTITSEQRLYLHYNLIFGFPKVWLQVEFLFPRFDIPDALSESAQILLPSSP